MQHKLLRKAGLLTFVFIGAAVVLTSCIDEPDPPVLDRITSEVRFVLGIPDAPAVDVWVDGKVIYPNVGYKGTSGYLTIESGNRFLRLVPAGQDSSAAIFRRLVSVRSLTQITMAFYDTQVDPQLLITQERFTYADETTVLKDSADVKLVNLSSAGKALSFAEITSDTTWSVLIADVMYEELSAYERQVGGTGLYAIIDAQENLVDPLPSFGMDTPGFRFTLIAVGNSAATSVLILQDEPK